MRQFSKKSIISPKYQVFGICLFCGHRLSFWEKRRKTKEGKVLCRKCGNVFYDKNRVY